LVRFALFVILCRLLNVNTKSVLWYHVIWLRANYGSTRHFVACRASFSSMPCLSRMITWPAHLSDNNYVQSSMDVSSAVLAVWSSLPVDICCITTASKNCQNPICFVSLLTLCVKNIYCCFKISLVWLGACIMPVIISLEMLSNDDDDVIRTWTLTVLTAVRYELVRSSQAKDKITELSHILHKVCTDKYLLCQHFALYCSTRLQQYCCLRLQRPFLCTLFFV